MFLAMMVFLVSRVPESLKMLLTEPAVLRLMVPLAMVTVQVDGIGFTVAIGSVYDCNQPSNIAVSDVKASQWVR